MGLTNSEKGAYTNNKELSKTQLEFLAYCKRFGWGTMEIVIRNGEPVLARNLQKTVRFDSNASIG